MATDNSSQPRSYQPQSFDNEDEDRVHALEPEESSRFVPEVVNDGQSSGADFEERPEVAVPGETDFASIKFQRENTLLTNADKYSDSIREEAELYVQQIRAEVDQLNEQAELRYEEAAQTKADAEAMAKAMIAQTEETVKSAHDEAYKEGYEAGRTEGLEKRYAEAAPSVQRIEEILEDLASFNKHVTYYAEKDGVRLAMLMVRKILRQELKINKKAVWKLLAATLKTLKGTGTFKIWLSPEDHQFANAAQKSLERFTSEEQNLTFQANPELPVGNVLIETDRDIIDATFDSQLHHLDAALKRTLGDREAVIANPATPAKAEAVSDDPAIPAEAEAVSDDPATAVSDDPATSAEPEAVPGDAGVAAHAEDPQDA